MYSFNKKIITPLVFLLFSLGSVYAASSGEVIEEQQWLKEQENISESFRKQDFSAMERDLLSQIKNNPLSAENTDFIAQLEEKRRREAAGENQHHARLLYFLSFSIPEDTLVNMLMDAQRFQAEPVIRGLFQDDMRLTAIAMLNLVNKSNTDGVEIDHRLFLTYRIRAVPALVVTCDKGFDVLYGNLKISQGLQKIAKEGDCRAEAKNIIHH